MISAALVTILVGIAASNLGLIPYEAPAYSVVFQYLLPLTIPLLLFRADMWNVVNSTGTLFLAFLLGSGHSLILALLKLSESWIWSLSLYCETCVTLCSVLNFFLQLSCVYIIDMELASAYLCLHR